jgi:hypothetical protein
LDHGSAPWSKSIKKKPFICATVSSICARSIRLVRVMICCNVRWIGCFC